MSELSDAAARLNAATAAINATVTNLVAKVTNLVAKVGDLEAVAGQPAPEDPDVPAALAAMTEASGTMESLAKQDPQAAA